MKDRKAFASLQQLQQHFNTWVDFQINLSRIWSESCFSTLNVKMKSCHVLHHCVQPQLSGENCELVKRFCCHPGQLLHKSWLSNSINDELHSLVAQLWWWQFEYCESFLRICVDDCRRMTILAILHFINIWTVLFIYKYAGLCSAIDSFRSLAIEVKSWKPGFYQLPMITNVITNGY